VYYQVNDCNANTITGSTLIDKLSSFKVCGDKSSFVITGTEFGGKDIPIFTTSDDGCCEPTKYEIELSYSQTSYLRACDVTSGSSSTQNVYYYNIEAGPFGNGSILYQDYNRTILAAEGYYVQLNVDVTEGSSPISTGGFILDSFGVVSDKGPSPCEFNIKYIIKKPFTNVRGFLFLI
jgi:hypothetical protein